MTFGEKVRAARLTLNLSQSELAQLTGISERSLYTYEQHNTLPRKGNLQKLADALHVSLSYLTDEQETDPGVHLEEEAFVREAERTYGAKGGREASDLLKRAGALFAGGDLDEEAKEVFMQSMMQVYLDSKDEARAKFTPKTKRKSKPSLS